MEVSRCKLAKSYSMTKLSKLLEDSLILDTCWSDAWNLHRPTRIDIMNLNIFSSNKSSTSQEGLEAASCYFCWTVHLDWRDLDRLYLKNAVRWYQFRRRFGLTWRPRVDKVPGPGRWVAVNLWSDVPSARFSRGLKHTCLEPKKGGAMSPTNCLSCTLCTFWWQWLPRKTMLKTEDCYCIPFHAEKKSPP